MLTRSLPAAVCAAMFALAACSGEAPVTPAAVAQAPSGPVTPEKMENFTLVDHTGVSHELYSKTDAKAVVVVMQGVGCPIVQKMTPDLKAVQAAYADKGVEFLMLNSNLHDTPAMIAGEAAKFDISIPILKDPDQSIGDRLGAVRTAEVYVADPKTWKIVYHGPLNDRLTYGREKAVADNDFVSNVLDAVLAGETPPVIHQMADGCIINFPERDKRAGL